MKICEKCENKHDGTYGSGRFCQSKCARSYSSKNERGKTKNTICVLCGNETQIPKRASVKYAKCEQCFPKKNIKIIIYKFCQFCGKKLSNHQKKYCNQTCQQNFLYAQYINEWKNNKTDLEKNKFRVSNYIRRYLWKKHKGKCSRCGWNTPNPFTKKVILEIEHIDGDSTNNDEDNLDLICPNCHSLTSTYKALNYGNGNKKRLKYYKLIK